MTDVNLPESFGEGLQPDTEGMLTYIEVAALKKELAAAEERLKEIREAWNNYKKVNIAVLEEERIPESALWQSRKRLRDAIEGKP